VQRIIENLQVYRARFGGGTRLRSKPTCAGAPPASNSELAQHIAEFAPFDDCPRSTALSHSASSVSSALRVAPRLVTR
jgi:hypothetical protein